MPGTVVAVAGRRPDPPGDSRARFPAGNEPVVAERLRSWLKQQDVLALVGSAAAGTDILALEAALQLGIRCVVVLPTPSDRFRLSSVEDRPGDWGSRFDRILGSLTREDLRVLEPARSADEGYGAAGEAVLDLAMELAAQSGSDVQPTALLVWEGGSGGPAPVDHTARFAAAARERGIAVDEVATR